MQFYFFLTHLIRSLRNFFNPRQNYTYYFGKKEFDSSSESKDEEDFYLDFETCGV